MNEELTVEWIRSFRVNTSGRSASWEKDISWKTWYKYVDWSEECLFDEDSNPQYGLEEVLQNYQEEACNLNDPSKLVDSTPKTKTHGSNDPKTGLNERDHAHFFGEASASAKIRCRERRRRDFLSLARKRQQSEQSKWKEGA